MNTKMIAFCGIDCSQCGAYLATQNNDDEARAKVAAEWSQQFHADIKPEDINCNGCHAVGTEIFSHCKVCEIRKCGLEKELENCAHCESYTCEKLNGFFAQAPFLKDALDRIRKNL